MTLHTERLTLRDLTHADAAFVLRLLNEPAFIQQIGDRHVRTLDAARAWIDGGPTASAARFGFSLWRVGLNHDDSPIGICGLLKRDQLQDPDLGFAFLSEFWSRGYAYESAVAVKAFARDALEIRRLAAIVLPGNVRSIGLLERLGFRAEGTVRLAADEPELVLMMCDLAGAAAEVVQKVEQEAE
jgi:RimJ/RimL family protein N-acetyltransferase